MRNRTNGRYQNSRTRLSFCEFRQFCLKPHPPLAIYPRLLADLKTSPKKWLVTGCAGFIGSNLLETLLANGQEVVGVDNFIAGHKSNLDQVQAMVTEAQWKSFRFHEGDVQDLSLCHKAAEGCDYIIHQAARGSVPGSVADPIGFNAANVTGFLNMLVASRDAKVKRFVYASSSSVYGDCPGSPAIEDTLGQALSPYAVTKRVNELYAAQFARHYRLESRGLRYFNIFGARQDPKGAYAAVIPRWIDAMIKGKEVQIYGDGETTRDFCHVANVVQANLLAATQPWPAQDGKSDHLPHQVYNIANGGATSLNELHAALKAELNARLPDHPIAEPIHTDFQPGDVRHSLASIERAQQELGYDPTHTVSEGLEAAMDYYIKQSGERLEARS